MSDTPMTTEERLYSLSKQKLWDHVAQEQNRSMLESEEYDLWLVATESCRKEIHKARQEGMVSVIFLRCKKHYSVPVQNKNEFSGGECGGCIADQRDALRDRVAELEKDKARLKEKLEPTMELLSVLSNRVAAMGGARAKAELTRLRSLFGEVENGSNKC